MNRPANTLVWARKQRLWYGKLLLRLWLLLLLSLVIIWCGCFDYDLLLSLLLCHLLCIRLLLGHSRLGRWVCAAWSYNVIIRVNSSSLPVKLRSCKGHLWALFFQTKQLEPIVWHEGWRQDFLVGQLLSLLPQLYRLSSIYRLVEQAGQGLGGLLLLLDSWCHNLLLNNLRLLFSLLLLSIVRHSTIIQLCD